MFKMLSGEYGTKWELGWLRLGKFKNKNSLFIKLLLFGP